MIEVYGNLWDYKADAYCVTTNGSVKKNGEAVLGRGCAREWKERYPLAPKLLGLILQQKGNHVFCMSRAPRIFTFPVKHQWFEPADPILIVQSAHELLESEQEVSGKEGQTQIIVLPRPGCGNGQLNWKDVKPLISFLPDNFHVITWQP